MLEVVQVPLDIGLTSADIPLDDSVNLLLDGHMNEKSGEENPVIVDYNKLHEKQHTRDHR